MDHQLAGQLAKAFGVRYDGIDEEGNFTFEGNFKKLRRLQSELNLVGSTDLNVNYLVFKEKQK